MTAHVTDRICLLRRAVSALRRSISRSVLQCHSGVLGPVTAGLWQRRTVWHTCFNGSSQSVINSAAGWCSSHRSTTQSLRFSSTALAEGAGENSIQFRCSEVQMFTRDGTALPYLADEFIRPWTLMLEVVFAQRNHH